MMRLIYEKSSRAKVNIVQNILEKRGSISKEELISNLNISLATLDKYLLELHLDLPVGAIEIGKDKVSIDKKRCLLYDVQIYYLSQSIVNEVLEACFLQKNLSFERTAQNLFISPSKLFNVLAFLNRQLEPMNIQIESNPYVSMNGNEDSILVLYHLFFQLQNNPFERSFSRLDKRFVTSCIMKFFEETSIKCEGRVVELFGLWILAVADRPYIQKLITKKTTIAENKNLISKDSYLYSRIDNILSSIHRDEVDEESKLMIIIFILFNDILGIHFENLQSERDFYLHEIAANFSYHYFILSLLVKQEYNISSENIEILALKLEGGIKFYSILFPCYYLYREFFNPKLKSSEQFKQLIENYKREFSDFLKEKVPKEFFTEEFFEFLAHITSNFQKQYFDQTIFTVGVYSTKGTLFEHQLCSEIRNGIEVVPYCNISEETKELDLLLVDDLRLLNGPLKYKEFLLLGDYFTDWR